jgi:hypothetical protein
MSNDLQPRRAWWKQWVGLVIGAAVGIGAGAFINILLTGIGTSVTGAETVGDLPGAWDVFRILANVAVIIACSVVGYKRLGARTP